MGSGKYDPTVHSKSKLGLGTMVPVAPMVPTAAQMNAIGMLHLRLMGESYITTTIRNCVPPARIKEVLKAVKAQPDEMSYSGSDSLYKALEVAAIEAEPNVIRLQAGAVLVCKIFIDPTMDLVSSDETAQSQIDDTDDPDPTDDPDEND